MERNNVDWKRLQRWLQEASLVLEYCARLAMAKCTGDVEGALGIETSKGKNPIFLVQFDADDQEISEALIRRYVSNIGKLADAGWGENEDFPVFVPLNDE